MDIRLNIGVVAFGFGETHELAPNHTIGTQALQLAQRTGCIVFTDRDVYPHVHVPNGFVLTRQLDPTRIPTTYGVARMVIAEAQELCLTELYVVTVPCHMWRCMRDLRWAAEEKGFKIMLTPRPTPWSLYDQRATTWFTRSPLFWWPMEMTYRLVSTLFPGWYKRTRA